MHGSAGTPLRSPCSPYTSAPQPFHPTRAPAAAHRTSHTTPGFARASMSTHTRADAVITQASWRRVKGEQGPRSGVPAEPFTRRHGAGALALRSAIEDIEDEKAKNRVHEQASPALVIVGRPEASLTPEHRTNPREDPPMTDKTHGDRERISCPGCGRHDYVIWPQGQDTLTWKCFNCGRTSELHRGGKH